MTKRTNQPRLFKEMDERDKYERELFTAICTACGWPFGQLTKSARGRVNDAVKQLADPDVLATVEQIETVARGMLKTYGDPKFVTPGSITGNWGEFVGGTATDKRIKTERKDKQKKDSQEQEHIQAALALPSDQFDDLRELILRRDRGIMHSHLAKEPATKNWYLLAEMGRFLGTEGER